MTSPITNSYDPEAKRPKLDVERVWLYEPETAWTYSHHQSITHYKDRLYAIWSNGEVNEDDVGQRVLITSSTDFHSWTQPTPLVDTLMGKHSELVLTAAGFHKHEGTLAAYVGQYEYVPDHLVDGHRKPSDTHHMDTTLRALTTTDGKTWSALMDFGIPIVPNHGPQPTASGRLIISGNVTFPYTDDPSGLSGWTPTGIYPPDMQDTVVDDSGGFAKVSKRMQRPVWHCEGSFYQTDDRVLHMLLRTSEKRLWVAESTDDGTTWSEPEPTDFTDNISKFHFGRLPDKRFYYVGTPDPDSEYGRSPLVLSLSEDGVRFDQHFILADDVYEMKREGMHKGGQFGYPHTMVHAGHLYVIVSRRKEAVEAMRVPLRAL